MLEHSDTALEESQHLANVLDKRGVVVVSRLDGLVDDRSLFVRLCNLDE